ncbi:MAG: GGDEF domain-containing protein [Peptococcaceae bacterium]|nr:GGDEF domain-containing protein [Peptococcaceae bacterium]
MKYQDAFFREIHKENLFRFILISCFTLFTENILLWGRNKVLAADGRFILASFILFNLMLLLSMYFSYRKTGVAQNVSVFRQRRASWLYLFFLLLLAGVVRIFFQPDFLTGDIYSMILFAAAAFIYISPAASFTLYALVFLIFFLFLSLQQKQPLSVGILPYSVLALNLAAWILNAFIFRMRIDAFIEKKEAEETVARLQELSIRDTMTMLYNHDHAFFRLKEEINRAQRIQYPLTIAMIDIDDFKDVNDRYGHLTGDKIIVAVAQILRDVCRNTDIIGRYGGEEFILIMPDTDLKNAILCSERLLQRIQTTAFPQNIHITVSGGLRQFRQETAEPLIKAADENLYQAKVGGKNRFVW